MSVSGKGANNTDVFVVWNPGGEKHRSCLQVTVRPGKRRDDEFHIAFQNLLAAVKRLQELTRD